MVKLADNLLQPKNGQVSRKFAAAINGQVNRKFTQRKSVELAGMFLQRKCLSPIVFYLFYPTFDPDYGPKFPARKKKKKKKKKKMF